MGTIGYLVSRKATKKTEELLETAIPFLGHQLAVFAELVSIGILGLG